MNARSPTVLILGAGACQLALIRRVRALGLRTVVASIPGAYPGFAEADIALGIDVADKERILQAAVAHHAGAVVTNQTDASVGTVAFVADQLGLPGIGAACAQRFTNKFLMRQAAQQCGVNGIAFARVTSPAEALAAASSLGFPLVMKPVANQGSRGVSLVHATDGLAAALDAARAYAPTGEMIIEQYVEGREVTVDGVMLDGCYQHFPLGDVRMFPLPGKFIPQSILYPSTLPPTLQERVFRVNERIVRALGLPFGLTHAEYRVDARGQVTLLEIGARGGGMFISSDLVPLACGIEPEEILLRLALGLPAELRPWRYERASGFYCFHVPPGQVDAVDGLSEALAIPGVRRVEWPVRVGERMDRLVDKTSRRMLFILAGGTREDVEETIRQVTRTLTVRCRADDRQSSGTTIARMPPSW